MRYFDANATTPLRPAAMSAWANAQSSLWQNPASPSSAGARAASTLEHCREQLATLTGTRASGIVFTSGATEANNAVAAFEAARTPDACAIVSAIEHPSVLEPVKKFFGARRLRLLPVDASGTARLDVLKDWLAAGGTTFVSLMAVNNDTGVVQPVAAAHALAALHGARFHCDATQWFGKFPAGGLPACDYISGSAHKFGGPKGTGFLIFDTVRNAAFSGQCGGGQEHGRRAGTVNLPGIAAMLAALDEADAEAAEKNTAREAARTRFEEIVLQEIPGAHIHGSTAQRAWNTVSLALPRHDNLRWMKRLERLGFTVSTGSACASLDGSPSHTLAAMGCDSAVVRRTLRLSAYWETLPSDWHMLAGALGQTARALDEEARHTDPESGVITVP